MTTTKDLWEKSKAVSANQQQVEVHPADDSYVPPVTSVKLPSRGKTYPPESPLYQLDSVDIKPVTAKEENILHSQALIRKGNVLSTLMRACITNRTIDPDQMLVGDRNAILTAIRISAFGPIYEARVECPQCGESVEHDFDLSLVKLNTLDVDPVGGPGTNQFEFELPVSKKKVIFRLLDQVSAMNLSKEVEQIKKTTGQEKNITMRLLAQIVSISGVEDKKLPQAVENLAVRDSRALRAYMDKIAPEVDMVQNFECQECGKTSEVAIPVGTSFFWPADE